MFKVDINIISLPVLLNRIVGKYFIKFDEEKVM